MLERMVRVFEAAQCIPNDESKGAFQLRLVLETSLQVRARAQNRLLEGDIRADRFLAILAPSIHQHQQVF